ncbi:hypothetical protein ACFVYA_45210 [Amycolatopsis sp. NPDC058278]
MTTTAIDRRRRLAVNETGAHLDVLVARGRVPVSEVEGGARYAP